MKYIVRGFASLISLCLAVMVGGTAFAAPHDSPGSVPSSAGVAGPADKALKVRANTVDVDGVAIQIRGVGTSEVDQKRHVWNTKGVKHVAQRTETGAQLISVLASKSSPQRISYALPGHKLQLLPDGSVSVVDPRGKGELVAHIEKPWAKDANGAHVPTHYEVAGSVLTQVVNPTPATEYPVVADPSMVRKWYGAQVRFSKSETRYMGYGATACTIMTAGIPDPTISKIATASCAALALAATVAQDHGNCLAANIFWNGSVVPWYWNC